jgi:hypothetical protein
MRRVCRVCGAARIARLDIQVAPLKEVRATFWRVDLKPYLIAALAVLLTACQTSEEVQESFDQARPTPQAVKSAIVNDARDFLADPYSIRDAEISYMQLNARNGIQWVCVKANAKNAMGGYSGRQSIEVWVRNGRLVGNVPNSPACRHSSLRWQPFPELGALRNL